ncbi:hypothetical protein FRC11_001424, partial [Ceratobasidium sp. 423]
FFTMPVDAPPDEVILHYNALQTMCFDIVKVLNSTSVKYAHADPALANHLATLKQQTQTKGPGTPSLADMGVQVDPAPSALPTTTAPPPLPARPAQPATLHSTKTIFAREHLGAHYGSPHIPGASGAPHIH